VSRLHHYTGTYLKKIRDRIITLQGLCRVENAESGCKTEGFKYINSDCRFPYPLHPRVSWKSYSIHKTRACCVVLRISHSAEIRCKTIPRELTGLPSIPGSILQILRILHHSSRGVCARGTLSLINTLVAAQTLYVYPPLDETCKTRKIRKLPVAVLRFSV
jgi:hypothetical protein